MARRAGGSRVSETTASPRVGPTDVFKALGDPVRWSIICQAAEVDELAASLLEETLDVSRPTISYHTKILVQAGLFSVRKQGRNFYYTLRRDVLRALIDDVWALAPEPRPVRDGAPSFRASSPARRRGSRSEGASKSKDEVAVLTW